jgi:hypothetical protein
MLVKEKRWIIIAFATGFEEQYVNNFVPPR